MSIFKNSFTPEIRKSLDARQKAIEKRSPQAIQYLNARNAWIRMSSSVNVRASGATEGTNELAKSYILQGGTLNPDGTLKTGVSTSSTGTSAYDRFTPNKQEYLRGIKPMPGITSIDVASKSAYGSLREVKVNFQCWDIKQLEDLELLYMRPGYSVLVEWGWLPYLENENTLQFNINTYDIINQTPAKDTIWAATYDKANTSGGNYEAMFGLVKNYSWSARADGGYDCTTTIISTGEIIESLKVNYSPLNIAVREGNTGLFGGVLTAENEKRYKKNILAGIFSELYGNVVGQFSDPPPQPQQANQTPQTAQPAQANQPQQTISPAAINALTAAGAGNFFGFGAAPATAASIGPQEPGAILRNPNPQAAPNNTANNISVGAQGSVAVDNGTTVTFQGYNFFKRIQTVTDTQTQQKSPDSLVSPGAESIQLYITLESLIEILNSKVLLKDKSAKAPFVKLSTKGRAYEKEGNQDLLCLAHPLQLSVDPTICLIGNAEWSNVKSPTSIVDKGEDVFDEEFYLRYTQDNFQKVIDIIITEGEKQVTGDNGRKRVKDAIVKATKGDGNKIKELNRQWGKTNKAIVDKRTLYFYLTFGQGVNFSDKEADQIFGSSVGNTKVQDSESASGKANKAKADAARAEFKKKKEELAAQSNDIANSIGGSQYLKNLESYFYDKNPYKELGIIGKIYINIQFLYGLSLDNNLESQDKKEKQDISLYDFIKNILSQVSNSIGNVNNFDIHVDPIDNIARIIDINYVDSNTRDNAYNNAFTLEMHNLKSTARSYKLESQIFPEQSTIIAVGSQVKGSALGTGADTMVDFNKNISDRIIPAKIDPNVSDNETQSEQEQLTNLKESLRTIYSFLGDTVNFYNFTSIANFDANNASTYKNALRDLIAYFKSIGKSDSKNRAIIPTKLSVELDGIGGLIIGHIFKIPKELLPKGYQGGALGSKQGYIITGLSHKVANSDWTTEIGAQTIILDNPTGTDVNYKIALQSAIAVVQNPAVLSSSPVNNGTYKLNPPLGNLLSSGPRALVEAAKNSLGFSTKITFGQQTKGGSVGCAAAVSVIFLRATGRKVTSPNSIIYNTPNQFNKDIELSTFTLYDTFSKDTKNWKKRSDWRNAQPGDIIVTATGAKAGHTGVVIDTTINRNGKNYYKIISNTSSGYAGSAPGTIQPNYDIYAWEFGKYSISPKNPSKTAAFEYIGPFKSQ
jgi:hypothetical protein